MEKLEKYLKTRQLIFNAEQKRIEADCLEAIGKYPDDHLGAMRHLRSLQWTFEEIAKLEGVSKARIHELLCDNLSPKQQEISSLLKEGLTLKEIADKLQIAVATVKRERSRINRKLK